MTSRLFAALTIAILLGGCFRKPETPTQKIIRLGKEESALKARLAEIQRQEAAIYADPRQAVCLFVPDNQCAYLHNGGPR